MVEKRDTLKSWTILLAILAFSLSLLGTFLVRSGVLTSVHAFANDPTRGIFILALLVIAIGGSLALFAWRAPAMQGGGMFAPISREGGLVLNNLLLATAAATVLLGTLYPLILDTIGGPKISVGAALLQRHLRAADGAAVPGRADRLDAGLEARRPAGRRGPADRRLRWPPWPPSSSGCCSPTRAGRSPPCGVGARRLGRRRVAQRARHPRRPLPGGRSRQSLARAQGLPRSAWAMTVAHVGLGVVIVGITVSSAGKSERILVMRPGESTDIAGYAVHFDGVGAAAGPELPGPARQLHGHPRRRARDATLTSEKRFYPVERMPTTEAGTRARRWRDLYVVLGDQAGEGELDRPRSTTTRSWSGSGAVAAIMALGGAISLTDRRLRVGAPRPAKARVAAAALET